MGYVIGAIIVIVIVYYLVVFVIAPIAGVLGMIALSIGVLYAFVVSISSYISIHIPLTLITTLKQYKEPKEAISLVLDTIK